MPFIHYFIYYKNNITSIIYIFDFKWLLMINGPGKRETFTKEHLETIINMDEEIHSISAISYATSLSQPTIYKTLSQIEKQEMREEK